MPKPLEFDAAGRAKLTDALVAYAERYLATRPDDQASWPPPTGEYVASLAAPPSETALPIEDLLARVDLALDSGLDTSSGKFLSYIPSGGLHTGAMARMLGAVLNRYTGGSHGAPGMIALEHSVIDWMCRLFELPETASGVLLSGGSVANLTAVVAARSRMGEDFSDGTIYLSERVHHSMSKAASIAGIRADRLRTAPTDDRLRIDITALRRAVDHDVAAGLRPMLVAATAGTTDTGTVDPLGACAVVAAEANAWFHVDAAYGGFFMLTERGRNRLAGIERADSITLDAHKSLFLPFGVGGLLVRDQSTLVHALDGRGSYMQDVPDHGPTPNYFAMSPELTRPARGFEVWLALNLHGVEAFRYELDRMLDLAAWSADVISAMDEIELVAEPELSVVAFRATAGDEVTKTIAQHLVDSGDVHVSTTTIEGSFVVRLAFLSQRTTRQIATRALELIAESVGVSVPRIDWSPRT